MPWCTLILNLLSIYVFGIPSSKAGNIPPSSTSSGAATSFNDFEIETLHQPLLGSSNNNPKLTMTEDELKNFMEEFNTKYAHMKRKVYNSMWNDYGKLHNSNLLVRMDYVTEDYEQFIFEMRRKFVGCKAKISDERLRYQTLYIGGYYIHSIVPTDSMKKIETLISEINQIYMNEKYTVLSKSADSRVAKEIRENWMDLEVSVRRKLKPKFVMYLNLLQNVSKSQGFNNPHEFTLYKDHIITFDNNRSHTLLKQYSSFHARLRKFFSKRLEEGIWLMESIPESSLAIYFLDTIQHQEDLFIPYPTVHDPVQKAIQLHASRLDVVEMANTYYNSMGFDSLDISVIKNNSLKVNPNLYDDTEPLVLNLFNGDYKMVLTSRGIDEDIRSTFEGVAMIHILKQTQHFPPIMQDICDVFKRAIAGAATLSAFSPSYLTRIGVLNDSRPTVTFEKGIINRQLKQAVYLFATLLPGTITDKVTQEVYKGNFGIDEMESKWFRAMKMYLGLKEPLFRSTENGFGPGTVEKMFYGYHYSKKFLCEILKYQFFQHLCIKAGQFNPKSPLNPPLYRCDISNDVVIGNSLKFVMQQGNYLSVESKIGLMTGTKQLEIQPLLNYFKPLDKWLEKEYGSNIFADWMEDSFEDNPIF